MGDSTDGSSNAAQRALAQDPDPSPAMGASVVSINGTGFSEPAHSDTRPFGSHLAEDDAYDPLGSGANGFAANASAHDDTTSGNSSLGSAGFDLPVTHPTLGDTPDDAACDDPEPATRGGGFLRRLFSSRSSEDTSEDNPEPRTNFSPDTERRRLSLMNLRRMRVEDVAIPKAEIVAVPSTITQGDLVKIFRDSGMTRLPVYQGTLDTPVGMVHLKDFALKHGWNAKTPFSLKALLRPLLFVPPSMPIGVLLTKMQTERRHMALVIDEYGGVDGLVTIEDLIEQVIGEIEDEHDVDEAALWTREASGSYLALAKTPLDAFEEAIGTSLTDDESVDEEEIDTLGGLVVMLSGRVPTRGEVVEHPAGHEFEVVEADPRRIKRVRVRLNASAATSAAS